MIGRKRVQPSKLVEAELCYRPFSSGTTSDQFKFIMVMAYHKVDVFFHGGRIEYEWFQEHEGGDNLLVQVAHTITIYQSSLKSHSAAGFTAPTKMDRSFLLTLCQIPFITFEQLVEKVNLENNERSLFNIEGERWRKEEVSHNNLASQCTFSHRKFCI